MEKANIPNMNGKYLISPDESGGFVIVKKDFDKPYKEDGMKTNKDIPFFDKEADLAYVPEKKRDAFVLMEDNYDSLKFLKKSYFRDNYAENEEEMKYVRKKNGFIINTLDKFFGGVRIHNKGETSAFVDDNGTYIHEVNSTVKVPEFGDNFLLFKEFVMFSNSFLIKENMLNMFSTFEERNIGFMKGEIITGSQNINWSEKKAQFASDRYWEQKLSSKQIDFFGTSVFANNIFKLMNGYFYGVNSDLFLYYFIDNPEKNGKILVKPMLKEVNGEIVFSFKPVPWKNFLYSEIIESVHGIPYYKNKQWDDYMFGLDYHKFAGVNLDGYYEKKKPVEEDAIDFWEI